MSYYINSFLVTRIIEIAGGRELYSQSRTKAVRKLRHNNTHKHNLRNKVRSLSKDTVDYAADNLSNEVEFLIRNLIFVFFLCRMFRMLLRV